MTKLFHTEFFGHRTRHSRARAAAHPVVDLLRLQTFVLCKGSYSAVALTKRRLHILPMKNFAHACL